MSKLITVTSLRNGVGRTTMTALTATKLANKGYKVLAIDNSYKYCDLAHYLMVEPEYSIDDLKPYLGSGVLEQKSFLEMVSTAEKEIDVLAGSTLSHVDNSLKVEDITKIRKLIEELYDYIIIDLREGIDTEGNLELVDQADKNIIVAQPNKYDYSHYERILNTVEKDKKEKIEHMMDKSIIIYNKVIEEATIDYNNGKKLVGEENIYKIKYRENLLDYCNGYKCNLKDDNEKQFEKIITFITNEKSAKKKDNSIKSKLKNLKSIFNTN
jgi:MinD-like ATPase involved in chromosome partitioning or flagellar assembly